MRLSYPLLRRIGLSAQIALVIALASIPTSLFVIFGLIDAERRRAIEEAEAWVQSAAADAIDAHRMAISVTGTLLEASSRLVDAGPDAAPCHVLPSVRRVVWLIQPEGGSVCSTERRSGLPDGLVARMAELVPDDGFTVVGPYDFDTAGGRLFGVLTRQDASGTVWHLVQPIVVEWKPMVTLNLDGPHELALVAIDASGGVFRHSHATGRGELAAAAGIFQAIAAEGTAGSAADAVTIDDIDGVRRIYGSAMLEGPDLTIMVGLSHGAVVSTAQRELIGGLALLALVISISGLAAWLITDRMVLRSVRDLRNAAVATAGGAHGLRVEIENGPVELRQLAEAFNEMTGRLERQAFHDQLTGLANRRLVSQHLDSLVAESVPFVALAIDLDGFKPVNDQHGHAVGDAILAEVAARMLRTAPDDAVVGRTGGDEFIILLPQEAAADDPQKPASAFAGALLDELGRPFGLKGGGAIRIGACIGLAFWPQDGASAEQVVRDADSALYAAKSAGRNRYAVFRTDSGPAGEAAPAPPPVAVPAAPAPSQSRRVSGRSMRMPS